VSDLAADLAALGDIGADGRGGVTRLAWSPSLEQALAWCAGRMADAGLDVEHDAAGNLIGRWGAGSAPAILTGSHLDTVPSGGRFDGALGVLTGIETVRRLRREGFEPGAPIWVAAFMDEEGVRFATSMLGSRAFCGEPLDGAGAREDADSVTLAAAMRACGRDVAALGDARAIDRVGAYVELHTEQGPRLERERVDVGIVTAITGMRGLRVHLRGAPGHAGTTPMNARRDALVGAARLTTELRDAARRRAGVVATVGTIAAEPGAPNVVPGAATLSVDLRSADEALLEAAEAEFRALLDRVAREERLDCDLETTFRKAPLQMDAAVTDVLEAAAASVGASALRMPSGAGHDAMVIGRHVPAGMLFVPSEGGVSHAPEEHTDARACERGAAVLAETLRRLSSG
jgi:hydantoinase/carbamoylase family amidase